VDSRRLRSNTAAIHRVALGVPAQHSAREIGDARETRLLQHHRRLRRASARAADGDDRPVALELVLALAERAERDERGTRQMAELALEFVGLAHIDDLHLACMLF